MSIDWRGSKHIEDSSILCFFRVRWFHLNHRFVFVSLQRCPFSRRGIGECPTIQSQNCTKICFFSEGNASSEETSCKSNCDLQKLLQVSFELKSNQMEMVGNRYPFEKMCAVVKISDLSRIWGCFLSFNTGNSSRFTSRHSTCWSLLYLPPPLWE